MIKRPEPSEYAQFYQGYIRKVPPGNIIDILHQQLVEALDLFESIGEEKGSYRYAPGKWSVKEVIGHIIDAERLFAYRAMCMARNDKTPLPSMDQELYVRYSNFEKRPLANLAEEFEHLRLGDIALFRSLDDEAWSRRGTASGFEFSVRSFPFIIGGHTAHHLTILRERYRR